MTQSSRENRPQLQQVLSIRYGYQDKYNKSADDDRVQADDDMNGVRPKAEAWRPIHSRHVQNTPSAEMTSRSLLHDPLTSTTNFLMSLLFPWNRSTSRKISLEHKLTMNNSCEKSCRW